MASAGEYRKLHIKQLPRKSVDSSSEERYWRRFRAPQTLQQIGNVTHISCSGAYPHDYAVTSATRVLIYSAQSHSLKKSITRFPDTAHSGTFRSDGRLIVAGCESGIVQVFDLTSRSILRQFKLHKRASRVALFGRDKTTIMSGSDDATVRLWDLSQGEQLVRLDGHVDYVRAGAAVSDSTWLTGSYDHTVRLWDERAGRAVMSMEHGQPVEALAPFPSGRVAASAGGTSVCLWDLAAGGRLIQRLGSQQKTVTSVQVVDLRNADGRATTRLISGSLDGHVKVYDLDTFKVAYAYKYPAPVLSVAVTPDLAAMIVGMADRSMVVRKHKQGSTTLAPVGSGGRPRSQRERRYAPRLTASTYKYFLRGTNAKAAAHDFVVKQRQRARLREYDVLLKQFRYADALDAALRTNRPDVVAALVEELAARSGLASALSKRSAFSPDALMAHVSKYIAHPMHAQMMVDVCNTVLDMHPHLVSHGVEMQRIVHDLKSRLGAEIALQQELQTLQGSLAMVLGAQYHSE